jgi:hypothetical protein
MWRDLERIAPYFTSAVLTSIDADGYPTSTRVQFTLDTAQERVRLRLPAGITIGPGSASLLMHSFNDKLWDLRSYMVRGTLTHPGEDWVLAPEQYTPGMSQSPVAFLTFVRTSRRKAAAYLKKRGQARPTIPWDDIIHIKKKAGL